MWEITHVTSTKKGDFNTEREICIKWWPLESGEFAIKALVLGALRVAGVVWDILYLNYRKSGLSTRWCFVAF